MHTVLQHEFLVVRVEDGNLRFWHLKVHVKMCYLYLRQSTLLPLVTLFHSNLIETPC